MRLIACSDTGSLRFTKDLMDGEDIPPYAILSHTWGDQEVLFNDLLSSTGQRKAGFNKIRFCIEQSRRDDLGHCWIDTCCIQKSDPVELQDAINSMFRWYARAARCYVYLADVSTKSGSWQPSFRSSRWFTRGWTLQELLAPRQVIFFSREGEQLGDRTSLEQQIHEITGISKSALRSTPLNTFTVGERLSWTTGRKTTRKEDMAYSLLGIFGIFLPPIYGEGEEHAFKRLYREIDASIGDVFRRQALSRSGTLPGNAMSGVDDPEGRFMVPFNRPRFFAGRDSQLVELRSHIVSDGCQRAAIYGLGGCGKTAIALEIAYWTREHHPGYAVFWVPAFSRDSFDQAYHQIAKLLSIPGLDDYDQANVRQLVKSTLSDDDFGPWLMIVDNADDETVLYGKPRGIEDDHSLSDYLPQSHDGTIVFTTRTRVVAERLAGTNMMPLGELDRVDAVAMLSRRLFDQHQPQLSDTEVVDELLDMLQFHALAIVQATAFMNTNEVALSDYIALYRDNEKDATDLLGEEFEDQGRYREATNAVAMTWYISFEQLQKQNSVAADHLCFMACTASNDIDTSMFPPLDSKVEHYKAMGSLKAYAFVTEQRSPSSRVRNPAQEIRKRFDVHPLVHLAMRGWLKAHRQWPLWLETTLARLIDITPYGNRETRSYWQTYLHHGMHLAGLPEALKLDGRMTLLERIGGCERELGRYGAAEHAYRQAHEQRIRMTGKEHPNTLMTRGNIGAILGSQGRWDEAARIHQEVYNLMSKVCGADDPHTLTSKSNVAMAKLGQRKYAEAEALYRDLLLSRQQTTGPRDVGRLTTMHNLAAALRGQAKYAEAHSVLSETLAQSTEILGEEDAYTLTTLANLASVLHHQQDFAAAETLYREALEKRKTYLGDEHPDTITSMLGLGTTLRSQDKLEEAEEIQRDVLALCDKVSGPRSPLTLTHKSSLAQTLRAQSRYADAEELHREVLGVREKVLGKENADTAMSVYWLAALKHDLGKYEAALPLYERALDVLKRTVGEDDQTARECEAQLGWIRGVVEEDRGREEKRKKERQRAEEDRIREEEERRQDGRADTSACAGSIATRSDIASETLTAATLRPQSRWRNRLEKLARRSGTRDESF